jgi:hypothetical protein
MELRCLSEETMLPEDNIAGDSKMICNRIITSITFLSFSIAKEAEETRTRL